ncbi:MAG TPA: hypothetical protein VIP51_05510 [Eoetvoesiella sp.]
MSDITDTRRTVLQRLVDNEGLAAVAKKMQKPASQIKDMLARRKSFGEKVAREIEKNYNPDIEAGWLDVADTANNLPVKPAEVRPSVKVTPEKLWPFTWVDEDKIRGLKRDDLIKLEAAILIAAAQTGLDVKSPRTKSGKIAV